MSGPGIPVRLTRHDDIYERLVQIHEGLSEDESRTLNAKLILVLANQVGDAATVLALIDRVAGRDGNVTQAKRGTT